MGVGVGIGVGVGSIVGVGVGPEVGSGVGVGVGSGVGVGVGVGVGPASTFGRTLICAEAEADRVKSWPPKSADRSGVISPNRLVTDTDTS